MLPDKALHGFFLYGHGDWGDFGTTLPYGYRATNNVNGAVLGPPVRITYAHVKSMLKYQLGAVILFACRGDSQNGGRSLVSNEGDFVFQAWDDVILEATFMNLSVLSLFQNGKQGTKIVQ